MPYFEIKRHFEKYCSANLTMNHQFVTQLKNIYFEQYYVNYKKLRASCWSDDPGSGFWFYVFISCLILWVILSIFPRIKFNTV